MEDSLRIKDKIEWAVKRLRNYRSRGPSGMQAEHLKEWFGRGAEGVGGVSKSRSDREYKGSAQRDGGGGRQRRRGKRRLRK